ncbi:MAG: hypothetical protein EA425_04785 [Puniceicoccaceae bacterium]|nr:MAG: hypothetical protein EA425_04785 [Puniceicoccaceae bacterium]
MNETVPDLSIPTVVFAGLAGGIAMLIVMHLITRTGFARGSMPVALGSLITGRRENAFLLGGAIHLISAMIFAGLYDLALRHAGITALPLPVFAGLAIGLVHGLIVSLALVWVVSDHHPLPEFQRADLRIGVCHAAGHVAFGAVVGLVIGVATALRSGVPGAE